ncbi:MAG: hypothetical protein AB7V77_03685 [Candidatus Woesearchaeota archaeon]
MKTKNNYKKNSVESKNIYFSGLILLILMLQFISLTKAEFFEYQNETFEIIPIVDEICNLTQTKVFHIIREEYNENSSTVNLNYNQKLIYNTTMMVDKNFSKDINSYTKTNTGEVQFLYNGKHFLDFNFENYSYRWEYNITLCQNYSYDDDENSSENEFDEINETEDDETEEIYLPFSLNTNKRIYYLGETVKIYFNEVNVDDFEITYWIEDLKGNVVKNKYVTYNLNYKSYTPNYDEFEKTFVVKAELRRGNETNFSESIFTSYNANYTETMEDIDEVIIPNVLEIKELEIKNNEIIFQSYIEKNQGLKRILDIYVEDFDGKKVSDVLKLDLKKSAFKIYGKLKVDICKENEPFFLVMEGLDLRKTQEFEFKTCENYIDLEKENKLNIINISTQKKYLDDDMIVNVKIDGDGDGILIVECENNSIQIINFTNKDEQTYKFNLNATIRNKINTILIEGKKYNFNETIITLIDKNQENVINKTFLTNEFNLNEIIDINNEITGNVVESYKAKTTNIFKYILFIFFLMIMFIVYLKREYVNEKINNLKDLLINK